MSQHRVSDRGCVYLVGGGPGDPGLITVRGLECLRQADFVLYDSLVNPALLTHVPPGAETVCLAHRGAEQGMTEEEIHRRLVHEAERGKTVVRLKGGDPTVFGRGADEIGALRAAGISFEVVPGVTAALAAASYAEIPITHGDDSSALALVTGHQRRDDSTPLDYGQLAGFPGTLVFYMGVASAGQWSRALVDHGRSPETPVLIVQRCTWSDQQTVACTLGSLAEVIEAVGVRPPTVMVVGEAARRTPQTAWFAARPLFGTRVLVTRPREQASALCRQLSQWGAEVITQPAIVIGEPADWAPVDAALARLDRYDWLVFSSVNGVRCLLDRLEAIGADLRRLGGVKLAAIGPGTAEELARYRLRADVVPGQYRAEALASALAEGAVGRRFLLARASRGREVLAERLHAAGGLVDQIVVYSSTEVEHACPEVAEAVAAAQIDWITVSSSAIAQSLVRMFGDHLTRARLASISPVTSASLRALGYEPSAEATDYTMQGLAESILRAG
jgi:uroporphyrinogen III methyltransferase/synthase